MIVSEGAIARAAATARTAVDLPAEPTTATTRVRRASVRRQARASRDVTGHSR